MQAGEDINREDQVLDLIKVGKPISPEEIADQTGFSIAAVEDIIEEQMEDGRGITAIGDSFVKTRSVDGSQNPEEDDSDLLGDHFKIGIMSDAHLAAKEEKLEELHMMYDVYEAEGVKVVYNAGDITEGWGVYRGQEFEVKLPGQEEQIAYAIENYPRRPGIITKFITGNHDLRQYERGGVDPGRSISRERDDLIYLGPMAATVNLKDNVKMELLHPAGGLSYAISYKAQKYINNLTSEQLPDILVFGHYHTSFYMHYKDVHFLQAPCFKGQGLWEKRLGLNPTIGGWLVEGAIKDGVVSQFKPELHTFKE